MVFWYEKPRPDPLPWILKKAEQVVDTQLHEGLDVVDKDWGLEEVMEAGMGHYGKGRGLHMARAHYQRALELI